MIELYGDMWSPEYDEYRKCVLVNCSVYWGRGDFARNPMGGGTAADANRRYPGLDERVAAGFGHFRHSPWVDVESGLIIFPTKHSIQEKADIQLITTNLLKLIRLSIMYDWPKVLLPRPGAGLGGLKWERDVKPQLESRLKWDNSRISIIHWERLPRDFFLRCECGHLLVSHEGVDTGDPPGRIEIVCHGDANTIEPCHCSGDEVVKRYNLPYQEALHRSVNP